MSNERIYRFFEELDNVDSDKILGWQPINKNKKITQSTSIFKKLSNKIKFFESEWSRNNSQHKFESLIKKKKKTVPKLSNYESQKPLYPQIKKKNINFNGRYNIQSIHTFRVSKGRQLKKSHTRSISNVQTSHPNNICISGSQKLTNTRKALKQIDPLKLNNNLQNNIQQIQRVYKINK